MLPVIRQRLEGFPFGILGVHADHGSEYINNQVATLLGDATHPHRVYPFRHRHNDTILAESENDAVVRKHLGYTKIPQQFAE